MQTFDDKVAAARTELKALAETRPPIGMTTNAREPTRAELEALTDPWEAERSKEERRERWRARWKLFFHWAAVVLTITAIGVSFAVYHGVEWWKPITWFVVVVAGFLGCFGASMLVGVSIYYLSTRMRGMSLLMAGTKRLFDADEAMIVSGLSIPFLFASLFLVFVSARSCVVSLAGDNLPDVLIAAIEVAVLWFALGVIACSAYGGMRLFKHLRPSFKKALLTPAKFAVTNMPQLICIGMLLWALQSGNPHGYFFVLRIVLFTTGILLAIHASATIQIFWIWLLGIIAFAYNPIFPVHMSRDTWSLVNVATIIILFLTFELLAPTKKQETDNKL